ncbi:Retrovirus-related Pol polyprotein from transposon TNT 1-94 [Cucumis melo var. makuwa]|uniref:Retrovirus-related Pol polyprotein from transposon TNT 1-94 n=1 Tax=Cucumis melo var. makuwa TaxID=1194695 RepID=A0A5A7U814_CUCMM|nr:Retrovirus-related Pol polyprotein from transposon TNT 1-94 [Cucumis melo var. makuwa]
MSRSSYEAKYKAMANTTAELTWISFLLRDMHYKKSEFSRHRHASAWIPIGVGQSFFDIHLHIRKGVGRNASRDPFPTSEPHIVANPFRLTLILPTNGRHRYNLTATSHLDVRRKILLMSHRENVPPTC